MLVAGQRAGRSVESDQFASLGIDQRKPRRERRALRSVRIGARRIENDNARLARSRRESMSEISNADCFNWHVSVAIDLSIDRNEIIVAVILNPPASEVDKGLHVRACRRGLLQEIAKGGSQGLAIKVARANDVKACGLQSLRDKSSVIGGGC